MTDALFGAITIRRGHFRLESGHHSDLWMDLETLCLRPGRIEPLAVQLAELLRRYEPHAVCGPLNEGAFVGLMVAAALDCDFLYTERIERDTTALFPVEYRLPLTLRPLVGGRRVAVVNDVTSAGSAVLGTVADLRTAGAEVVAIGSLLLLGDRVAAYGRETSLPVERLTHLPHNAWVPAECPLCASGRALDR